MVLDGHRSCIGLLHSCKSCVLDGYTCRAKVRTSNKIQVMEYHPGLWIVVMVANTSAGTVVASAVNSIPLESQPQGGIP